MPYYLERNITLNIVSFIIMPRPVGSGTIIFRYSKKHCEFILPVKNILGGGEGEEYILRQRKTNRMCC